LPTGTNLIKVGVQAGAGDITIDASGGLPLLKSTVLDFTADINLQPGMFIWIGGDAAGTIFPTNAANNAAVRVRRVVDANTVELDKATKGALVTESPGAATIELYLGRLLKNQTGSSIVHPTYQIERTLGAPDDALPAQIQSEYFTGCVYQKATINYNPADKITVDSVFLSADHEVRTGAVGVKAGTRPSIESDDGQNTTSDLVRIRLAQHTAGNEAPSALVAFVERLSLDVDNGDTPLKALTVLGAIQHSPADFMVTGSMDAYFAEIAVIDAVRNNVSCTLDLMNFKSNAGWVVDLPLITLNDGGLKVEKDNPIMIPIGFDAASGEEIDTNLDYTAAFTFFDYLPTLAATPN
jgi:hypothetical protein